jgi:hypothetical protein
MIIYGQYPLFSYPVLFLSYKLATYPGRSRRYQV